MKISNELSESKENDQKVVPLKINYLLRLDNAKKKSEKLEKELKQKGSR